MKKAKVYLETINYKNEVVERSLIATFRNAIWAEKFVDLMGDQGKCFRLVVEE